MFTSRKDLLRKQFEELLNSDAPQRRGYSFQDLLSQLLRDIGFHIYPNATAAAPRQTDIVAEFEGRLFLIEVKWKKKNLGSNDIDDLRARLRNVPPDVIGCIFN